MIVAWIDVKDEMDIANIYLLGARHERVIGYTWRFDPIAVLGVIALTSCGEGV